MLTFGLLRGQWLGGARRFLLLWGFLWQTGVTLSAISGSKNRASRWGGKVHLAPMRWAKFRLLGLLKDGQTLTWVLKCYKDEIGGMDNVK